MPETIKSIPRCHSVFRPSPDSSMFRLRSPFAYPLPTVSHHTRLAQGSWHYGAHSWESSHNKISYYSSSLAHCQIMYKDNALTCYSQPQISINLLHQIYSNPVHSSKPSMMFIFWTAAPLAPFPRLSKRAVIVVCSSFPHTTSSRRFVPSSSFA